MIEEHRQLYVLLFLFLNAWQMPVNIRTSSVTQLCSWRLWMCLD